MNKEQGAAGPGSFMPMVTATAGVGVKRAVSGKAQEELRHMCKGREAQEMNLLEATAPSPWSTKNDEISKKEDLKTNFEEAFSFSSGNNEETLLTPHPEGWLDCIDVNDPRNLKGPVSRPTNEDYWILTKKLEVKAR